jgi:hypothetical protein
MRVGLTQILGVGDLRMRERLTKSQEAVPLVNYQ